MPNGARGFFKAAPAAGIVEPFKTTDREVSESREVGGDGLQQRCADAGDMGELEAGERGEYGHRAEEQSEAVMLRGQSFRGAVDCERAKIGEQSQGGGAGGKDVCSALQVPVYHRSVYAQEVMKSPRDNDAPRMVSVATYERFHYLPLMV